MAFTRRGALAALTSAALVLSSRRSQARPLDDVMARGRLRVSVYRDFPPFSFGHGEDLKGIDVDLARLIAAGLGLKVEFHEQIAGESVNDDLRVTIWRGSLFGGEPADIMMHVPYHRQFQLMNPETVLFAPYHRENFALVRNAEQAPSAELDALPDAPIGVEAHGVADAWLLSAQGGRLRPQIRHYGDTPDAVAALLQGEVVAALGGQVEIEAHIPADRRAQFPVRAVTFSPPLQSFWDIGLAAKENSRDLAYAIGDIVTAAVEDGRLAQIFAAYGAKLRPIPVEQ